MCGRWAVKGVNRRERERALTAEHAEDAEIIQGKEKNRRRNRSQGRNRGDAEDAETIPGKPEVQRMGWQKHGQ